jgi:hypothetical protein
MTPGDLRRLQRLHWATPGDVLEWRRRECGMTSSTGEVVTASTPGTVVFDTALPPARASDLSISARDLVEHLARTRARTGLGGGWSALIMDPTRTAAVGSLLGGRADEAVIYWVGRGAVTRPRALTKCSSG